MIWPWKLPLPVHLDVMLRNYHMCISQFFISHYLPPFHPSNLIIDQGSPRKKSNSQACGAIFMLLATFSWSELFHELSMHQRHLEKSQRIPSAFWDLRQILIFLLGSGPKGADDLRYHTGRLWVSDVLHFSIPPPLQTLWMDSSWLSGP